MAKRELSAEYRRGVQHIIQMLGSLAEQARQDVSVMMDFPDKLHAELSSAEGDLRRGMEDCLACHVRMLIEGNSSPVIGRFDPTDELEDPEDFYCIERAETH
ncbi:hypothetical protein FHX57_002009 [Paraburkholderia tropica]|uniref:hypothetical protein n=1 Tax=Paraburkholderia tropica TaxID=92647 RepID=UPI0016090EAD|nr:hypothetical protein [Paraburkholderia tropica]MBB2999678.1 hypothetical protein [Paraburkholderia tropica]